MSATLQLADSPQSAGLRNSGQQHCYAQIKCNYARWRHCYEGLLASGSGPDSQTEQCFGATWGSGEVELRAYFDNGWTRFRVEEYFVIGIDLENSPQAAMELVVLSELGGENCQIHEIGSVNVSDLFSRIQVELGITRQTGVGVVRTASGQRAVVVAQRNQPVMRVSRTSFAVIFNIDVNDSIQGSRYRRVKKSSAHFLANTPADDLVAGLFQQLSDDAEIGASEDSPCTVCSQTCPCGI